MDHMSFLDELAARRRFGIRPGLASIRALLAQIGNPERGIRCIHVAGTNGKGATTAMIDSILRAAGYRVLRYTSPHLVRLNERFFVDGEPVADSVLAESAERVFRAVEEVEGNGVEITFFEALTAVAFDLFRAVSADSGEPGKWIAVLETGLGGRLDATNVVDKPLVSVVTRIGLDHTEWLGSTHAEVAVEKAGIVKMGCPVVAGAMPEAAKDVIARAASLNSCDFTYAPEAVSAKVSETLPDGQTLLVTTAARNLPPVRLPLGGSYQAENAVTTIAVVDALCRSGALDIPDRAIIAGLSSVVWPGRFQHVVRDGVGIIVDGAHNPDGARALRDALRASVPGRPLCLIAGFCGDKDVLANLRILSAVATCAIAVPICNSRSLDPAAVAERMHMAGFGSVEAFGSLKDGLSAAMEWARETGGMIVIGGSLFLAGEALDVLGAFPWQSGKPFPNEKIH